jgi:thioredoxin reductase (NADPH)
MAERTLKFYGALWCPDCRKSKQFLNEHRVPYEWIDITDNEEAIATVERINEGKRRIPTLLFADESVLVVPTNAELAAKLGLQTEAKMAFYDVIIIGAGPAGLTAAIYAARDGSSVLVIERGGIGGQTAVTSIIDNFPGFPEGISGEDFADRLRRQTERFGAEILQAQEVKDIQKTNDHLCVRTDAGGEYGARAVLLATGAQYRRLNVPGEEELIGAGVHFCATCDGPFYKDKSVAVIGGGNSAAEESLFLIRFAKKVTIFVRGSEFKATRVIVDKLEETEGIDIRYNTEVRELRGEGKLESLQILNRESGEEETFKADGAFVFIGLQPNTKWLPESVAKDEYGFVITGPNLETSMPGVFAAGDLRQGSVKQAASAAGEGTAAALMIREYLSGRAEMEPKASVA